MLSFLILTGRGTRKMCTACKMPINAQRCRLT